MQTDKSGVPDSGTESGTESGTGSGTGGESWATSEAQPREAEAVPSPYELTIKRSLFVLVLLLASQFVGAFLVAVPAVVFDEAASDSAGFLAVVTAIALLVSLGVVWWFMRADMRRFGSSFGPQIGWSSGPVDWREAGVLILGAFLLTRAFAAVYAGLALEEGGSEQGMAEEIFLAARESGSWIGLVAMFLAASFAAPVVEEIVFRGYLQSALRRKLPAWAAIAIASAIFAGIHGSLMLWPIYFAIGVGLGYVYDRTGHLKAAIAFHMANNIIFSLVAVMT